jgi:hypothetical protein
MGEDMEDEEVDKSGYDSMEEGGETQRSTSKLNTPKTQ